MQSCQLVLPSETKKSKVVVTRVFEVDDPIPKIAQPLKKSYSASASTACETSIPIKHNRFVCLSELDYREQKPQRALTALTVDEGDCIRRACWQLAAEAINTYPSIQGRMLPHKDKDAKRYRDALGQYPEMPKRFRQRSDS